MINTNTLQGEVTKQAQVFGNDPANPSVMLSLSGEIWIPIQVDPKHAEMLGVEGQDVTTTVLVTGHKDERLTLELTENTLGAELYVELVERDDRNATEIRLFHRPKNALGFRGQITLATNYPEKPELVIPFSARIRPMIDATPKILDFGSYSLEYLKDFKNKEGPPRPTRPVTIVSNTEVDLEVERVEMEKGLYEIVGDHQRKGRILRLVVAPVINRLTFGMNRDTLRVYTDAQGDRPIDLPISLEIVNHG